MDQSSGEEAHSTNSCGTFAGIYMDVSGALAQRYLIWQTFKVFGLFKVFQLTYVENKSALSAKKAKIGSIFERHISYTELEGVLIFLQSIRY